MTHFGEYVCAGTSSGEGCGVSVACVVTHFYLCHDSFNPVP